MGPLGPRGAGCGAEIALVERELGLAGGGGWKELAVAEGLKAGERTGGRKRVASHLPAATVGALAHIRVSRGRRDRSFLRKEVGTAETCPRK